MINFLKRKKQIDTNLSGYKKDTGPVVLLVLDGWGMAPASKGNAITQAETANFDYYFANFPSGSLIASGESVGLTANEEGNSEVGHLTLGAGRVVPQSLVRINQAILDDSFYQNDALLRAIGNARDNGTTLHLAGLVGTGEVHSSIKHFWALLELVRKTGISGVRLHLFTDGRDSPPTEALGVIKQIEERIKTIPGVAIATISGRYYARDRDRRWERTEKVYKAMVLGQGVVVNSASEAVEIAYAKKLTDEFIEPSVIISSALSSTDGTSVLASSGPVAKAPLLRAGVPPSEHGQVAARTVQDGDSVVFFNFRIDRPRQVIMAFTLKDFEELKGFEFDITHIMRRISH
jgi:2,3-bisphosphoglycerate-independent phosphoglycerate mutase